MKVKEMMMVLEIGIDSRAQLFDVFKAEEDGSGDFVAEDIPASEVCERYGDCELRKLLTYATYTEVSLSGIAATIMI